MQVRLLLHHVPRTYVNFEQAEGVIENGKHVFFTGKIWTSKYVSSASPEPSRPTLSAFVVNPYSTACKVPHFVLSVILLKTPMFAEE